MIDLKKIFVEIYAPIDDDDHLRKGEHIFDYNDMMLFANAVVKNLAIHDVSKRTLKRICDHKDCNKEFTLELNLFGDKSKANIAMMQCPHCNKRNDLWLELS